MATNTAPKFTNAPYSVGVQYTNSDSAATKKDLVPAAAVPTEGMRIDEISLASTDTSNRVVKFYDHDGSTSFLIGAVSVTTLAGTDGATALVDAIPTLAPSLGYIELMTGHKLQAENVAQVTSAKQIDIVARGGKYTA